MKTVVAVFYLVHAAYCLGPKFEIEFGIPPGYWEYEGVDKPRATYLTNIVHLQSKHAFEFTVQNRFYLRPEYYRRVNKPKSDGTISIDYLTSFNLYYGEYLLASLRLKEVENVKGAEIPDGLLDAVQPVITEFHSDGFIKNIKVYFRIAGSSDQPCYFKSYEGQHVRNGKGFYFKYDGLYDEPDEKICACYLVEHAAYCLGPKFEIEFGIPPGYWEYEGVGKPRATYLTHIVHPQSEHAVQNRFYLRPEYYRRVNQPKSDGTISIDYLTSFNLYYGEYLLASLRLKEVENVKGAEIPDGLLDAVKPVITEFHSDGFIKNVKVYYRIAGSSDQPCYFKSYEGRHVRNGKGFYFKYDGLYDEPDEKICACYLVRDKKSYDC